MHRPTKEAFFSLKYGYHHEKSEFEKKNMFV